MTYGLQIVWKNLRKRDLQELERVKAVYLKKVLCVSKYTLSRLVYVMSRESFFVEEIRHQRLLPFTAEYAEFLLELQEKRNEIWEEFYATTAMIDREWEKGGYELRHVVTRYAVHGFHYKACSNKKFHQPNEQCECQ